MGPALVSAARESAGAAFAMNGEIAPVLGGSFAAAARVVGPALLLLGLVSWLAVIVQVGPIWSPRAARPESRRLSAAALAANLRAAVSLGRLGVLSVAILAIGVAGFALIRSILPESGRLTGADSGGIAVFIARGTADLLVWVCLAACGAGLLDIMVRRRRHLRSLRMTREEARREQQEEEGNATHAAARRRLHDEVARDTSLQDLGGVRLVIAGKGLATALRYEAGVDDAPRVVVVGRGWQAVMLARTAESKLIPIAEDSDLALELCELGPGTPIPESTFGPIAEWLRRTQSR